MKQIIVNNQTNEHNYSIIKYLSDVLSDFLKKYLSPEKKGCLFILFIYICAVNDTNVVVSSASYTCSKKNNTWLNNGFTEFNMNFKQKSCCSGNPCNMFVL